MTKGPNLGDKSPEITKKSKALIIRYKEIQGNLNTPSTFYRKRYQNLVL